MNYIEYINFPSIPNELLDPIENIINSTRINSIVKQDFFKEDLLVTNYKTGLKRTFHLTLLHNIK